MLIDGPTTQVPRQIISIKRLTLTKMVAELPRGARSKTVRKVMEKESVVAKFQESTAGKKIAKAAIRRNLTDFDRHNVMLNKMKVENLYNYIQWIFINTMFSAQRSSRPESSYKFKLDCCFHESINCTVFNDGLLRQDIITVYTDVLS